MSGYKDTGSITISSDSNTLTQTDVSTIDPKYWEYYPPQEPGVITPYIYPTPYMGSYKPNNNKGGDDDMRYLYEVILVNPKNDKFFTMKVVARTETSALMKAYIESEFGGVIDNVKNTLFDDLKTCCRILMEWKKEKSLEKALETIKKAVE